ncbi:MarR family transcriptional regulator [Chitinophaga pendula]|uniref:GbsR/MarR family transcriptional regulator n=1 Tax=Chitinophaga TaxID=79328 RepID=UPI000BAED025|nr:MULTISPECIES: MarR family transcriptional regulator [Chitinophaga]ASZ09547.1 transcriptional regulator [Chitinophaga sp. MD30]UCJ07518.1 MarR family transcriptional regulator [Chitinophaga pendula]
MKLTEAKAQFVQTWGSLGAQWGINRTMAQIHALLLIMPDPLSAEDIMQELNISRGNTNMNVRELINWGLVERVLIPGERREYFSAEKDIWKVATCIARERKKRELDPIMKVLNQLQDVEGDQKDKHVKAFRDSIQQINKFAQHTDNTISTFIKSEENWFYGALLKLIK